MATERDIKEAARIIKLGGLVVYPTETVYGIAANIRNRIAILKVFAVKRRPLDNPLSVAVKDLNQADELVYTNRFVKKLAKVFLPGPLTIILKKKAILPKELNAGSDKLGIRIPKNFVALRLIELAGPITATSANVSGKDAPKNAYEARGQLGDKVNFVLDDGKTEIGETSTVVEIFDDGKFKILRKGVVTKKAIKKVLES